ncbi:hypothetical protein JCM17845_07090 [Iodidimonas gelatinilytica]|uniref:SCO family protein n=1 Tax=Iodidimonas gelatinilytica TaxID=1236966 RepID=A0A5A7MZ65_9PROT|nr:SCO family protein [Iodidimonas gelatinilytica]GER00086.1 hypothetical protein JCM17845_07090 [Iodidimonas gelatinilytica]
MTISHNRRSGLFALSLAAPLFLFALPVVAQDAHAGHDMHKGHDMKSGEHEMGHGPQKFIMFDGPAKPSANYKITSSAYRTPDVTLYDQSGTARSLKDMLDQPGPVALQFIFTSCATVCPVLSASFSQASHEMADLAPGTRLLSISIDPEYDTPERLARYAQRYNAGENWTFLTGSLADIRTVIGNFDALLESNNKIYHRPYTYLRSKAGAEWTRLDGLLSKAALVKEFTTVLQHETAAR